MPLNLSVRRGEIVVLTTKAGEVIKLKVYKARGNRYWKIIFDAPETVAIQRTLCEDFEEKLIFE